LHQSIVPDILYTIILFIESYRIFSTVLGEVSMLMILYISEISTEAYLCMPRVPPAFPKNPKAGPITRKGTISPEFLPRIDG
jgi:hypothetical protein